MSIFHVHILAKATQYAIIPIRHCKKNQTRSRPTAFTPHEAYVYTSLKTFDCKTDPQRDRRLHTVNNPTNALLLTWKYLWAAHTELVIDSKTAGVPLRSPPFVHFDRPISDQTTFFPSNGIVTCGRANTPCCIRGHVQIVCLPSPLSKSHGHEPIAHIAHREMT